MKKITTSTTNGGAPIYLDDFKETFNDEIWDAIQSLLSPFDSDTQGIILSGCVVGGSGPSSYTISAGIVYIDGEFRRFAAATGLSLPQYIKAATDVNTSRTFEDATNQTLFITKSADLATSAPGSGQYVAITTTTDPDDRRLSTMYALFGETVVKSPDDVQLYTKVLELGDWNMDTTTSLNVTHGIADYTKIRSVEVIIREDSGGTDRNYKLEMVSSGFGFEGGGINLINATVINLSHPVGSFFDSTSFNATSYNRGWITIMYEA